MLALTVAEWLLLVVAIGPVVLVGIIIWIFWRAASGPTQPRPPRRGSSRIRPGRRKLTRARGRGR